MTQSRADLALPVKDSEIVTVLDGTNAQDIAVQVLGLNLRYYGNQVSSVWISENGNLNFNADGSFFPESLGNPSVARIAPLWDDFLLLQDIAHSIDNRVVYQESAGAYFAVTWENVRLFNETVAGMPFPSTNRSVQVGWFESGQTYRGFGFMRDDIIFSYVPHQSGPQPFGDIFATVGLDSGNGKIVPLLGTSDGFVAAMDGTNLAWQENSFLLYRWNSLTGNYDQSLQFFTSVPEPSAGALILLSLVTFVLARTARTSSPSTYA